jgi:NADH:ubiquinone reductase (non-electrogenic)
MTIHEKPRLIVLGTGFAAFSLLKSLKKDLFDTTVISPRNHFLFTPLLPSTTVGTLEFRSIIESIRRAVPQVRYYEARCTSVDADARQITCMSDLDGNTFTLPFEFLVIAVGAVNNTYGVPGVEQHALFLKELADARGIRQRISDCFERASQPSASDELRKRLLRFVVVGGGPTGVEFAAELHDFVREDLKKPYRLLMPFVRITILESGVSILSAFDTTLREYTSRLFNRSQIEVLTNSPVTSVDGESVNLRNGTVVPYGLLVWSTGIGATPFVLSLPFAKNKSHRLLTDEWFRLKGYGEIYAVGDCAAFESYELPATSQVAQQEGSYLATLLKRSQQARATRPFRYHHFGMLAYVGGNRALADLALFKGRGLTTWIFWRSAYLTKLVSLKNKILVIFDWIKTMVFGRDISRF